MFDVQLYDLFYVLVIPFMATMRCAYYYYDMILNR